MATRFGPSGRSSRTSTPRCSTASSSGPAHVPRSLLDDLDRFHWDDATVKVDWNLDGPIPWTAEAARRAGTLHLADGVDALTVSSSELARSLVPAHPFLLMGQQSMTDRAASRRAPRPHGRTRTSPAASRATPGPARDRPSRAAGPTTTRERMADRMESEIEASRPASATASAVATS